MHIPRVYVALCSFPPQLQFPSSSRWRTSHFSNGRTNMDTRKPFACMVDEVSAKWRDFGLSLGTSMNMLNGWETQENRNAVTCWELVMDRWLTQGGTDNYPATWAGLHTLLKDHKFVSTAGKLKEAVAANTCI